MFNFEKTIIITWKKNPVGWKFRISRPQSCFVIPISSFVLNLRFVRKSQITHCDITPQVSNLKNS